ncbi:unnamed protein product [Musa acuminata subsp. malaccensis]|uniref:(wild Malaysian banana) hypothetical protein n=1 Tax=Musa acuminata subsp. malaccensis TaxID=214687 RepID=A0A804IXS5_MUSAM|nr:unnamed protein product [Musa acuminata subsp. malaccensis]
MIHKIESSMHVALAAMSAPPVSLTTYAVPASGTASLDSTRSFERGINGSSSARTVIHGGVGRGRSKGKHSVVLLIFC